ncbi:hypothetical protein EVA_16567 [gut metagenome]|uniref:Uncharacterized protein n=1 Tax=gut metagenome TaxID=749906 RepID=J9C651_9ZZZZ
MFWCSLGSSRWLFWCRSSHLRRCRHSLGSRTLRSSMSQLLCRRILLLFLIHSIRNIKITYFITGNILHSRWCSHRLLPGRCGRCHNRLRLRCRKADAATG